jgi:uncharacterized repeat protein (TIGR03803 family)
MKNFKGLTNLRLRFLPVGNSLAWTVVVIVAVLATRFAGAQTYKVLYAFTGGARGSSPTYQLVRIGQDLYGTAEGGASGDGVVFKLAEDGRETVLHSFSGDDGNGPAGLVSDAAGNLYGLTQLGGNVGCNVYAEPNGCGLIFEITRSGEFSVLYSFSGDGGANPEGKLLLDAKGNLYGAAGGGGQSPSCPGPEYEQGCGTIFELARGAGTWNETVLYNFAGGAAGFDPNGSLISFAGKLFGTAANGNSQPCRSELCGTIFELAPGKDGWTEKILHTFKVGDGAIAESLVADPQGNLYGTTFTGGASGNGTIFKIDSQGQKTILHTFDGKDGANPSAGLVRDSSGNLFGTANAGGSSNAGTVFRLDPANHLTVLHDFKGGTDGATPFGALLLAGETLYGTTAGGGHHNSGTVFEISK